MSSCKLKIIADSDLGNEPPLSLAEEARGQQPARPASIARKTRGNKCIPSSRSMVVTSDEEPALCEALIHEMSLSAEPNWLSTEHHLEKSVGPHNELPSVEQLKQSLSINPCALSSQVIATAKEAAKECSNSAPASEHAIEHSAKVGLIGGNQEDHLVPEGSDNVQHSNVPLEVPGCKAIYPPIPPPASYDAANPFAHPPQTEDIPDQLPGSGTCPLQSTRYTVVTTRRFSTMICTTLACMVSRLDGNGNALPGANHPPDIFRGDKDAQENDRI
ncbi:hypothetical protein F5141DRAFT_1065439 [Pisolithus sp. B1]|nr:hypothetical protein F5141DRAFT_1065439 [Pisolithus sp. B1]